MSLPGELADVLAGPLEGVTRIVLRHERRSRFRLLSLIELPIKVVFLVAALACVLVVFLLQAFSDGDADMGEVGGDGANDGCFLLSVRFYDHWHELVFVALDAERQVRAEVRHAPRSADEGEAVVRAVLGAADRAGIVVVETLGEQARETLEVWYGGQPLLAHPELRDGESSAGVLERNGFELCEGEGGAVEVVRHEPRRSKLVALLLLPLQLALLPLLFWQASYRRGLSETWLDLQGVPPGAYVLALHPDRRLSARRERGAQRTSLLDVDARDLLGVAFSATLGYDRDVSRREPSLRLVGRHETHTLGLALTPAVGRALRDALLVRALELWEGIPATTLRPTRCPYCGNLYTFEPGIGCPSCGASPSQL